MAVTAAADVPLTLPRGTGWLAKSPATILAWVLGLHVLVWTLLPALFAPNLQLDLVEDLALGREWQLGYWKHPPLPWWLADALYRIVPDERVVYLLGPLSSAVCFYAVWRLGLRVTSARNALLAVLALEGTHYYNFSVVKFAHDQMQLPFWALTGLVFYVALREGRLRDWAIAGALLALCFWSKYAAFVLAGTLGLFLLADPEGRRALLTPGPYVMALAFLIVIAPQAWWLVESGFQPFRYVDNRAVAVTKVSQYLTFPLRWTGSQLLFLLPTLGLIAILIGRPVMAAAAGEPQRIARRYLAWLALGPFVLTTLVSLAAGRLPVAMWGYPLWSFIPLAAIVWLVPRYGLDTARLALFARAFVIVFAAFPAAWLIAEIAEPLVRDRPKATQFPGRSLALIVAQNFRDKTGQPLAYVAGAEFPVNNVSVYAPERPHVIVHGDLRLSPWVDPADLKRRGVALLMNSTDPQDETNRNLAAFFPAAQPQAAIVLPRQTVFGARNLSPVEIYWAIVPPQM